MDLGHAVPYPLSTCSQNALGQLPIHSPWDIGYICSSTDPQWMFVNGAPQIHYITVISNVKKWQIYKKCTDLYTLCNTFLNESSEHVWALCKIKKNLWDNASWAAEKSSRATSWTSHTCLRKPMNQIAWHSCITQILQQFPNSKKEREVQMNVWILLMCVWT